MVVFFILDPYTAFQSAEYVTVKAERIPAGTYVCVLLCVLTVIKTQHEEFVVVQMLKSPVDFMYCCSISNISVLGAKEGKENTK